jgi:hypothetical protein
VRTLSALSLDQQIGGDGTWLDRELTAQAGLAERSTRL